MHRIFFMKKILSAAVLPSFGKRVFSFLALTLGLLAASALPAQAASDFNLATGAGSCLAANQCQWSDPVLTVRDGADMTVSGAVTNGRRIEVAAGARATLTLNGVSISMPNGNSNSPLRLNAGANLTLTLAGGKSSLTARSGGTAAGLQAPAGTTLVIQGAGELNATSGGHGAGIGGNDGQAGGVITINGGAVNAAIDDTVVVVNATSGGGAGIGGGANGAGGAITINGGTVKADATGSTCTNCGAGIGGGGGGGTGGYITIHGGNVQARGGNYGAGIGGSIGSSLNGPGGVIVINGGTVKAWGGRSAAGIGGGIYGTGGSISVSGNAAVTAVGGAGYTTILDYGGGAGIGSGGTYDYVPVSAGTIGYDSSRGASISATGGAGSGVTSAGANVGTGGYEGGPRSVTPGPVTYRTVTLTAVPPAGGTVAALPTGIDVKKIPNGANLFFTVTPAAHYKLISVTAGGQNLGAVRSGTVVGIMADTEIKATFAKMAVIGLAIKTQPKLDYTDGDALDLSALVVTLTYEDSSTEDVAFANFAANDITTDMANGKVLSRDTDNGKTIKVMWSNLSANTNPLTVAVKQTVPPPGPPVSDVPFSAEVPTLNEAGLALLALMMLAGAALRRRRG